MFSVLEISPLGVEQRIKYCLLQYYLPWEKPANNLSMQQQRCDWKNHYKTIQWPLKLVCSEEMLRDLGKWLIYAWIKKQPEGNKPVLDIFYIKP